MLMRLGPVLMDVVLPIPPMSFIDGNETLGPVLMDDVLPIPQARFVNVDEAGAGIDGCCAPDTASEFY